MRRIICAQLTTSQKTASKTLAVFCAASGEAADRRSVGSCRGAGCAMGTCGCHWARGRREAPAAKVAAGGRIPLARHTLRAGRCRRTGRAYAPLHCSLAAALTVMGLRHRPQSGSYRDCAWLPQTCATTVVGPPAAIRSALAIPSSSCLPCARPCER